MPRLLLATLALFLALPAAAQERPADGPRNVVLFIADGAGPATMTMARDFLRDQEGRSTLALDSVYVGSVRTFASNSKVTDSAAGATAFAAGVKTYNGAIAVDPEQRPVATVLEAAEARGMATGLVVTSRLTHATPAAFAAHVPRRSQEDEIARQMMTRGIDVLLGGGRRHFLPEAKGGRRTDGRDLMREARDAGATVVGDRAGFDAAQEAPLLGLFARSHMAYDIDRKPAAQPSLAEMTAKALELLASSPAGRENGFFLMVEGSRIDHAGHNNDAAAHVRDMLAYDEAIAAALGFAEQDGETLVVSTADHETGGLSLGRAGVYAWEPPVLARIGGSHGAMMQQIAEGGTPAEVLRQMAGIDSLRAEEEAALADALEAEDGEVLNFALADIIGRRAVVGWTTNGHTAVDVSVYAAGPGADRFAGHHDNTRIGRALADLLGFDLGALTQQLRDEVAAQAEAGEATGE